MVYSKGKKKKNDDMYIQKRRPITSLRPRNGIRKKRIWKDPIQKPRNLTKMKNRKSEQKRKELNKILEKKMLRW